jgi:hypothetical protein
MEHSFYIFVCHDSIIKIEAKISKNQTDSQHIYIFRIISFLICNHDS